MTMYRWEHDDLENAVMVASRLIGNLSYHFNRTYGLTARLHHAIKQDCALAVDGLLARKLKHDARALRTLARQLDTVGKKLTGRH
jgi:hypothetical protein